MKKVLSIVLSIAMVVCLAPTMAFAATTSASQAAAAYSDTEGTACEGAVNVLSALKVVHTSRSRQLQELRWQSSSLQLLA